MGTSVHVDTRKWDGGEHWQFDASYVGTDEYGVWLGIPVGCHFERPGAQFDADVLQVLLMPDDGYTPTFHARVEDPDARPQVLVYVDICTRPEWRRTPDGVEVTLVDMDLDVIRRTNGEVFVDDEDEFAEHQVRYGYPADVIAQSEADCARVLKMVQTRAEPFGEVCGRWLETYGSRTP
ncbi:hypothetical protein VV02_12175 [Luteipulveratus mongoliensis]|uniref:DUF402 domain-containing protein n=1 Tax=Luteipulveratus mongoliensis TaxID=571913 RepID=A0A0K1JQJ8_9MICO|nr:hypothetical protein VV02_12175 [Luteipulveratus mongoliensis]